jgi:hypothetical protein
MISIIIVQDIGKYYRVSQEWQDKNDTIRYKMVQNGIFLRYLKIILLHVSVLNLNLIFLYLKQYQTDNFALKMIWNWDYIM